MAHVPKSVFAQNLSDFSNHLETLKKASTEDTKIRQYVQGFLKQVKDGQIPSKPQYPLSASLEHSREKIVHIFSAHTSVPSHQEQLVQKLSASISALNLPPSRLRRSPGFSGTVPPALRRD